MARVHRPRSLGPAPTGLEHECRAAERSEGEQDPKGLRPDQFLHVRPNLSDSPEVRAESAIASAMMKRARFALIAAPRMRLPPPDGRGPWLCVPASRRVCPGRSVHREMKLTSATIVHPESGPGHEPGVPVGADWY